MDMTIDEYFEHHGVKDQTWGVKRGPPYPLDSNKSAQAKKKKQAAARKAAKKKARKEKVEALKKAAKEKRRRDILNDPAKLYKHRREFSQEEINNALKQFEWEKKLNDLSVSKLEAGRKKADAVLGYLNDAMTGYNQLARVFNTFVEGVELPYLANVEPKKKKKS